MQEKNVRGIILVIDDEQIARSVAKKILEKFGFMVLSARDGREGVDIFSKRYTEIAAVLLDMSMPDLNGREVLRQMAQIRPGVQVILSSGYNEQNAVANFSGLELAGFVQKPYQPATLVRKFEQVLNPEPGHNVLN